MDKVNQTCIRVQSKTTFEQEIFKRSQVIFTKLEDYGFKKEKNTYQYEQEIFNHFKAILTIDLNGQFVGKVYDLSTEEEYINFRIERQNGEFVNQVRKEYTKLLEDLMKHCFVKTYFITDQANRITRLIENYYHDKPEFLWKSAKGNGVFRNKNNGKWYGLIMNIDRSKLDQNRKGEIEALNVKLDKQKIKMLLLKNGFYPSYHMNKTYWITIILDDTLSDDEIMGYVKESHFYTS